MKSVQIKDCSLYIKMSHLQSLLVNHDLIGSIYQFSSSPRRKPCFPETLNFGLDQNIFDLDNSLDLSNSFDLLDKLITDS